MEIFKKIKRWFTPTYNVNDSIFEHELITSINPECFSKVHSSDFTMYKVRCFSETLDDYNKILTCVVNCLDDEKRYPTKVDFNELYTVDLADFFLKKGNYTNEYELVKKFKELMLIILNWIIDREISVEDEDVKYRIVLRVFTSSMSMVKLFLEIQNTNK